MPRLSLSRDDLTLLRDVLTDQMLSLDDARHQAEQDGDAETAETARRKWTRIGVIVAKVEKARRATPETSSE